MHIIRITDIFFAVRRNLFPDFRCKERCTKLRRRPTKPISLLFDKSLEKCIKKSLDIKEIKYALRQTPIRSIYVGLNLISI